MSVRVCSQCSALVKSDLALFCYNCGAEFERREKVESETEPSPVITPPLAIKSKRSHWIWPLTSFLIFLTFFLILQFHFFSSQVKKIVSPPTLKQADSSGWREFVSTSSALPVSPYDLTEFSFASLIPADAQLFIQSRLPMILLRKMISEEDGKKLTKITGLSLGEAVSFLADDYAYARIPEGSAFLGRIKSPEFVKSKITELTASPLSARVLSDILVVSGSSKTIEAILAVDKKSRLSLNQVAAFTEGRRNLPKFGQLVVYASDKNERTRFMTLIFGEAVGDVLETVPGEVWLIDNALGSLRITSAYERR